MWVLLLLLLLLIVVILLSLLITYSVSNSEMITVYNAIQEI